MFKYLCDNECPITYVATCLYCIAAREGHEHMLAHLHDNSFPITKFSLASQPENSPACVRVAAMNGQIACLIYLNEKGYRWNESTIASAAYGRQFDCVTYLHEHRCPWDARACMAAAYSGHLECLTYLHENGCPWDESILEHYLNHLSWAISCPHRLSCMRYMLGNSCPFPQDNAMSLFVPNIREACVKLVAKHLLLPRWREAVRWMIKVRPYAWHWYEEHQRVQCAPGGEGRKRDRDEFVEEMEPVTYFVKEM